MKKRLLNERLENLSYVIHTQYPASIRVKMVIMVKFCKLPLCRLAC